MKRKLLKILYWVIVLLPAAAAVLVYAALPRAIENAPGAYVDSGRVGVFLLPALNLVLGSILYLTPDSGRYGNALLLFKLYGVAFFAVMCFCAAYGYYTLNPGGSRNLSLMCRAASAMLGLGSLIAGQLLPRSSKQSLLTLRWHYTERSDKVWYMTHKLGARLFSGLGVLQILCAVLIAGMDALAAAILGFFGVFLVLYRYAKKLYHRDFFR